MFIASQKNTELTTQHLVQLPSDHNGEEDKTKIITQHFFSESPEYMKEQRLRRKYYDQSRTVIKIHYDEH